MTTKTQAEKAAYMRQWRANHPEYKAKQAQAERERRQKEAAKSPCPECGGPKKHTARICRNCYKGENVPTWRGGAFLSSDGYRLVLAADEPGANQNGYIREHRLVMQQHLGRSLLPDETVHHKNGIRTDNRLENLELWCNRHPGGQRVEDLLIWADEIIERYR